MRLEHFNYKKLVIEEYQKKRSNNSLSLLLFNSTPANIKQECLNVYKERYDKNGINKKDDLILRSFFGPEESMKKYAQIIARFDTDKFRPLNNYLKGLTDNTDDRNIDLLAWLIDFKPRPYQHDTELTYLANEPIIPDKISEDPGIMRSPANSAEDQLTEVRRNSDGKPEDVQVHEPVQVLISPDTGKKNIRKRVIGGFLITVIIMGVGYFLFEIITANDCMCWTGNQYEEISCKEKQEGQLIIPLDRKLMKQLKRITRVDTITEKSIGKIYYIKNYGKLELFTSGGNYPNDVNRSLKKLTRFMFDKYLKKNEISNNGAN